VLGPFRRLTVISKFVASSDEWYDNRAFARVGVARAEHPLRNHVLDQRARCTTPFPAAVAAYTASWQHITSRYDLSIETLLRYVHRSLLLTSSIRRRIDISLKKE
jgi:hypothetical protein